MGDIHISKEMSRTAVRDSLKSFGLFSEVEASIDQVDPNSIIFREVPLSDRLWRFLTQDKTQRDQNRRQSREALSKLAKTRPEFGRLLEKNVLGKQSWTASELRSALKIQASLLNLNPSTSKLATPVSNVSTSGVTDAKKSEIEADFSVVWKQGPKHHSAQPVKSAEVKGKATPISVVHSSEPDAEELKSCYTKALESASGHVVIEPIADVPVTERAIVTNTTVKEKGATDQGATVDQKVKIVGYNSIYSQKNLELLLDVIEDITKNNPGLRVTIAANEDGKENLFERIVDLQAVRAAGQRTSSSAHDQALVRKNALSIQDSSAEHTPPSMAPARKQADDDILTHDRYSEVIDFSWIKSDQNLEASYTYALEKAQQKSGMQPLVVKPVVVFDNDEPTNEAIFALFRAIDEHQQKFPGSRVRIAVGEDDGLQSRVMALRAQYEAQDT